MDREFAMKLKEARIVGPYEAPEDFRGIAYSVACIWDGALEDEWLVPDLMNAEAQAEALAQAFAGEPAEFRVSEVYVGDDVIEGTGYMADRVFPCTTKGGDDGQP